ncbi:uncharacterized protein PRCAT00006073001 [Priceomyces carsonii]|uniref:uncharacterized protein n=1 Tax=Priceomyces carsonii TaxID=28549 RepID=UPI002ED84F0F|nr:unnamed protein product [Priceomyces carsonii]
MDSNDPQTIGEDESSEFSYVKSEILNRKPSKMLQEQDYEENKKDDKSIDLGTPEVEQENDYENEAEISDLKDSLVVSVERHRLLHKDSASFLSHSEGEDDIAEPVSIQLVRRGTLRSVKDQTDHQQDTASEDTSVSSIGKLNTERSSSTSKLKPLFSFKTKIDESIPPRSPRRPNSDILYSQILSDQSRNVNTFSEIIAGHRKHVSLSINDDLDRLMESAQSLRQNDIRSSGSDIANASSISEIPDTNKVEEKETKKEEVIKKEEEIEEEEDIKKEESQIKTDLGSHQNADNSSCETGSYYSNDSRKTSSVSKETFQTADFSKPYLKQRSQSSHNLPPRPSPDNMQRAREVSNQLSKNINEQLDTSSDRDQPSDSASNKFPELQSPKSVVEPALPEPASPNSQDIIHEREHKDVNPVIGDEEYYDIGEPVLVHRPSQAKSVKDATKQPKTKSKKTRAKRPKSHNSNHSLKPFSYSTLISLLESTNGTIIGEEFNQLNLPIKEKQLIEKIVDSLSRLTLDMVIDQSRYDIGIKRLELALRALEGFI